MAEWERNLDEVVRRLRADVIATVGHAHEAVVDTAAAYVRDLTSGVATEARWSPEDLAGRLVEDAQQVLHDTFVDTTWPACPAYTNHPLWYAQGAWHCPRSPTPVAALGTLAAARAAPE